MNVTYRIDTVSKISKDASIVTVMITPDTPLNGFHGKTITFEVTSKRMAEDIKERVIVLVRQAIGREDANIHVVSQS